MKETFYASFIDVFKAPRTLFKITTLSQENLPLHIQLKLNESWSAPRGQHSAEYELIAMFSHSGVLNYLSLNILLALQQKV